MDFFKALQLIKENSHLIGETNEKGFTTTELVIVPTNKRHMEKWVQTYMSTKNAQLAIAPYIGEDVVVYAIDSNYLFRENILIYEVVE